MSSLVPPYRQMRIYRILGEFLWVTSVLIFLAGNVAFYFLIGRKNPASDGTMSILVILRVVLLDGLFLIMGITLGVCIIMIYTTRAGKDVLEVQRGGKVFPLLISALLILLFASRDIYSLTAAITNSRNSGYWILATDEGDYEFPSTGGSSKKYGYIAYFSVMMIWEVIPTYIIVFFFRVRIPHYHNLRSLKPLKVRRGSQSTIQRHFFDNPNRYDESEQLLSHPIQHQSSTTTHMSIPSLTSSNIAQLPHNHLYPHTTPGGYGSNQKTQSRYSINSHHHGNSSSGLSSVMPGTTPPQLFTSPSFFTDVEKKLSD